MKIKGILIAIILVILFFVFMEKEQADSTRVTLTQVSTKQEEVNRKLNSNRFKHSERKAEFKSLSEPDVNAVETENKNEPDTLTEVDLKESALQQATEFIAVDSELHRTLLEKLHSEHSSEEVKDEPFVILDDTLYAPYVTDIGIEFYQFNTEFINQIVEESDRYNFQLDAIKKDVAQQTGVNFESETLVYQLLEEFNSAEVQLINVSCRGQICLVQLVHPYNSLNVMEALSSFIKSKRQQCGCKALHTASFDFTESVFNFVFD